MKTLYFDLMCGASGDMILAALIDAGVPIGHLREQFARLDIEGLSVDTERKRCNGFAAAHMVLSWKKQNAYRHLPDLLGIIEKAGYTPAVRERCTAVLRRLAEAEARAHGIPLEKVHFHEIGAVDTIVDVLGAALCLEYLAPDTVRYSPLTVGRGTVSTRHGIMPVPVPAVANMIQALMIRSLPVETEIMTPTGCAILTAVGTQCEALPAGRVAHIGVGCGDREFDEYPNLIRAFIIETAGAATPGRERICVLESDVDHINGEIMAYAAGRIMDEGALDVSWSPLVMKKGRPGNRLTVVCEERRRDDLIETIIAETRTLGVRYRTVERAVADRSVHEGRVGTDRVRTKESSYGTHRFSRAEFDDLASRARAAGRPIQEVIEEYLLNSRRR